ncbi:MAG: DNA polymerase III subunit delta [Bacilli bacterium]|nr:DNA polymerase III subunit delta [Bacilli bacterium]
MNNLYLIYGEEEYLINKKINELKLNDGNNIAKYDLLETNVMNLIKDASMPSLLGNNKVIIGYNAYFLTSTTKKSIEHDTDALLKYINNPNPDTILILTINDKLDERKKIVKQLKEVCKVYSFNKLDSREVGKIVSDVIKEDGYIISNEDLNYLLLRTGNNLNMIMNEVSKLKLYKVADKEILRKDIFELVSKNSEDNIFDLIDSIINKDYKRVFEIYEDLLLKGEEPIKIIILLANQIRIIYQTKVLIKKGYSERDIASRISAHPYQVKLAHQKSYNFTEPELLNYLMKLADLDIAIKTGKIDKEIGLEMLFLEL